MKKSGSSEAQRYKHPYSVFLSILSVILSVRWVSGKGMGLYAPSVE